MICVICLFCAIDCALWSAWKAHDARRLTGQICFRRGQCLAWRRFLTLLTVHGMSSVKKLLDAAEEGDEESVRRLISEGVDVNEADDDGWTALMGASSEGHEGVVSILLENGAVVDQADDNGWTALMCAARRNQVEVVKLLLNNGANVDKATNTGSTALWLASQLGCAAAVAVLLEHNADINKVTNAGWSPLMWASRCAQEPVVRLLLARDDIDTTLRDKHGKDCLDHATTDEIKQLIINHRFSKEKQRLIDIGIAFASKQLPLLLLFNIYEQTVVFDDQQLSMFHCWEILKLLKKQ